MNVNKPILTDKLKAELAAAGIQVAAVVLVEAGGNRDLYVTNAQGQWIDPPPAAAAVIAAHDGTPPAPIDYGSDAVDQRDKIISAIQSIRAYQGLAAAAVTQAQRKQYEDLIGNVVISLAKRVLGNG